MGFRVWGLGFRVWGFGFRALGLRILLRKAAAPTRTAACMTEAMPGKKRSANWGLGVLIGLRGIGFIGFIGLIGLIVFRVLGLGF